MAVVAASALGTVACGGGGSGGGGGGGGPGATACTTLCTGLQACATQLGATLGRLAAFLGAAAGNYMRFVRPQRIEFRAPPV